MKKILVILFLTFLMAGCAPVDEVYFFEDMGVGLRVTDYNLEIFNSCTIETTLGLFRLKDQRLCEEFLYNRTVFKGVNSHKTLWRQ